ncbi:Penicillin-binding protein 4 [Enhygromyxa salina]|uniref:Penicillin-binding protein 4 n=1 Tax=Enhygromyxa salina TaxID=215803 RepID=A0A2S9XRB3_9BACT|nr:serine hydrolase domain-containing protein [Enhygromyxa salina]PRP95403.1 Penicillin-binding protein 4 [Enhygromyxa salina]
MPRTWIRATLTAATLVGLSLSGCGSGHATTESRDAASTRARYEETRESITRLARDLMRVNEVTGVSLALVDGDEVVWATGFGMADVDRKLEAGPRTVYDVGSLAKPITAAAVLQAVERGELDLDQRLATLIPELELAGSAEQDITLAQLLTHQSGLPSDWFIHSLSEAPPPWEQIVDEIQGLELAAEPGTRTVYSNLGMTLAGVALGRAGDRPYEQRVTETLLRPAGMRTAYFARGPEPEPVLLPTHDGPHGLAAIEHAAAYRKREARLDPEFRMAPAGGLHASVLDLAAFARLLLTEGRVGATEVLSPASVEAMLSPHNDELALDLDHSFGYAWFLDHAELDWVGRVASHGGRTYYHHARLILLPDHDLAVAVASNSLTAANVIESLAVETLILALQEKHGLEAPAPIPSVEHSASQTEHTDAFLDAHAGDYATSIGVSRVGLHEGEVWSRAAVGSSRLTLDGPDGGTVEAMPGARVRFLDEAERHLMVVQRGEKQRRTGVRLEPPAPLSEQWRAREGRWTLIERPGEVSTIRAPALHVVNGRLTLEFLGLLEYPPMPVAMALRPLDDARARIEGLARGQGTIVEFRDGGDGDGEHLWWAGREFCRRD